MRNLKACALAALILTAAGCQDDEDTFTPGENTRLEIGSDPAGANILLNRSATGKVTPATIFDIAGEQDIEVRLERDGIAYGYRAENVDVKGDSLHRVFGPLMFRCANELCALASARTRDLGRLRVITQANGALFMKGGNGEGLLWPLGSSNSYASIGMPLIAMLSGNRDTLALGIYDRDYLAGRPEPTVTTTGDQTTVRQSTWLVPPQELILANSPTVRGIEVEEQLIGNANSDVVFIKLKFTNITNRESYRAADPVVPSGGMVFDQVYVGFGMDPDIGVANDDMVTYEPAQNMVYAYDSNFLEEIFSAPNSATPGMVGLKIVSSSVLGIEALNAWPQTFGVGLGDWRAGTSTERGGFSMLSGLRSLPTDFPGQLIGHVPTQPQDFRMSVGVGPLRLTPGESVEVTVAVIMAFPVAGEYTSGQVVAPGSPTDDARAIRRIAGTLIQRAATLVEP
jgi:hypothetical protein